MFSKVISEAPFNGLATGQLTIFVDYTGVGI